MPEEKTRGNSSPYLYNAPRTMQETWKVSSMGANGVKGGEILDYKVRNL